MGVKYPDLHFSLFETVMTNNLSVLNLFLLKDMHDIFALILFHAFHKGLSLVMRGNLQEVTITCNALKSSRSNYQL